MVKKGNADAVVNAGNSGATLAAGILTLGRMEGVDRPAIAGILPGEKGPVILIDVGANVDCRPTYLFQFGVMATPGLVLDGKLLVSGRVPSEAEVKEWLS